MKKKLVVDRIEENILVCEDLETGEILKFEREVLDRAGEGDVLIFDGIELIYDEEETLARKKYIDDLLRGFDEY
jgi:zona occludens toxin (predicted ATPase)